MVKETKEYVYFKKDVAHFIGVRASLKDSIGTLLTAENPFVAVEIDNLRDFKLANKKAIQEGLIVTVEEPNLDWETPNTIGDQEIDDLLKNYMKLSKRLETITSLAIVYKILARAKESNRSEKLISLIQKRADTLDDLVEDPELLQRGVS